MPAIEEAATALYSLLMPVIGLPLEVSNARPRTAVIEPSCQNAGERYGRADRHIKSARDDDEHHAERQNAVDGSLFEDIHEVGRCDEAGLQAGKHNDQCNEDQENEVFADQSLDIFLFHFSFLLILQSRRPVS